MSVLDPTLDLITVAVTGGRDYCDVPRLWRILDGIADRRHIRLLVEGASDDVTGPYVGADYWAHQWALAHGVPTCRVHAKWKQMGKSAGPIRNQKILDEHKPDTLISFPGGHGTADMTRRADDAGIHVFRVPRK